MSIIDEIGRAVNDFIHDVHILSVHEPNNPKLRIEEIGNGVTDQFEQYKDIGKVVDYLVTQTNHYHIRVDFVPSDVPNKTRTLIMQFAHLAGQHHISNVNDDYDRAMRGL